MVAARVPFKVALGQYRSFVRKPLELDTSDKWRSPMKKNKKLKPKNVTIAGVYEMETTI